MPKSKRKREANPTECNCTEPVCRRGKGRVRCKCMAPVGHPREGALNMIRTFAHRLELAHTDAQVIDVVLGLGIAAAALRKEIGIDVDPYDHASKLRMTSTAASLMTAFAFVEQHSTPIAAALAKVIIDAARELMAGLDEQAVGTLASQLKWVRKHEAMPPVVHAMLGQNRERTDARLSDDMRGAVTS